MIIGDYNDLEILRFTSVGAYLGDEEGNDVLLPNKYLTESLDVGDTVCVFVYRDSEDRIVATTEDPKITIDHFAYLKAKSVSFYGAFMDWGLEKDLLIPFREQAHKIEEGKDYLVYLYLDEATDRLVGTTKTDKHLIPCKDELKAGDKVQLIICERTDLGIKVVVNEKYKGLVFNNDITKNVRRGTKTIGFISTVRPDGKLDIKLEQEGYDKIDKISQELLDMLKAKQSINLTDKSSPDDIKEQLNMSKKTFKQAVGKLYKERLIELHPDKITIAKD
ncbi:MAG: S1 RNA-binding domain-containing protein [Crocinitomicaceae bacterium]